MISPWDPSAVALIDKAIRASRPRPESRPTTAKCAVRSDSCRLTEERRKELVKHLHKVLENHRTAVRNIRRDIKEAHRQAGEGQENQPGRTEAARSKSWTSSPTSKPERSETRGSTKEKRNHGGLDPARLELGESAEGFSGLGRCHLFGRSDASA